MTLFFTKIKSYFSNLLTLRLYIHIMYHKCHKINLSFKILFLTQRMLLHLIEYYNPFFNSASM